MKGLLLKDMINMGKQTRSLLIIFFFYLVFAFFSEDRTIFGGIISIMMVMMVITSLAYDERAKWDRYALTMPLSRSQMVLSKYLLGLIFSAFAMLVNIALLSLFSPTPFGEVLILAFTFFGIGMFILAVLLPLMYHFGVEKGRMLMILVLFLPTAAILALSRAGINPPGEDLMQALPYILPGVVVLTVGLSILLSLRIYRGKEM